MGSEFNLEKAYLSDMASSVPSRVLKNTTFPSTLQPELFYSSMNSKLHIHSKDSQHVVC